VLGAHIVRPVASCRRGGGGAAGGGGVGEGGGGGGGDGGGDACRRVDMIGLDDSFIRLDERDLRLMRLLST